MESIVWCHVVWSCLDEDMVSVFQKKSVACLSFVQHYVDDKIVKTLPGLGANE